VARRRPPAAVFFDVDFTLIYPGPRFQARGYCDTCDKYGVIVDPCTFDRAVQAAAPILESSGHTYDGAVFEAYTRRIIELMGGRGPGVGAASREIFLEWAEHTHFNLYPDVSDALRGVHNLGVRIGLISNTHRCLSSFESHFELDGLISATMSSYEHGFMKPHPSIFRAALALMDVEASDAAMVGDSLVHDIRGAMDVGMRGILLARGDAPAAVDPAVRVIQSLAELPEILQS
jgi:HAD superfamily hydrolase (TIGR01509 family)